MQHRTHWLTMVACGEVEVYKNIFYKIFFHCVPLWNLLKWVKTAWVIFFFLCLNPKSAIWTTQIDIFSIGSCWRWKGKGSYLALCLCGRREKWKGKGSYLTLGLCGRREKWKGKGPYLALGLCGRSEKSKGPGTYLALGLGVTADHGGIWSSFFRSCGLVWAGGSCVGDGAKESPPPPVQCKIAQRWESLPNSKTTEVICKWAITCINPYSTEFLKLYYLL